MKKYNSFLGAFFSGDNGQGGYNAAYRKGALASLYNGQLDPNQQNEVAANLSRVDPEAAKKWQDDIVKQSANLLATLGKDNPLAVQAWQTRIKPNLSRIYGAQADALPDVPDDNAFAIARQIAGVDANQDAMPADIRTNQWYLKQLGYKPGSKEEQDFLRMRAGQIPKAVPYGFKYDEQGNVWVEDRNQGNIRPGQFGGQNPPPPAGSGGIVFPEDIPPAAARVSDIMEAARREIGQLVAGGMPVDQATTLVTQKYAKGRGLTMPTQGQPPASSQPAPTVQAAPQPLQQARIGVKPDEPKPATWNAPVVETRGGKRVRVRYGTQDGQPIEQVMGEAEPDIKPKKPWPTAALKVYSTLSGDLQVTEQLDTMMADMKSLFSDPKFELGPIQNKQYEYANWSGNSTPQSRAYAKLSANLSKLRNDSLRLNKGTQTDGDAQRAWDEIMANMNDKELVMERLADIERYNELALAEKQYQLEVFEEQYGKPNATRPPASPPAGGARPPAGAPVKISTKQQYDALPSGTEYIGPDGKKARKK